MDELWCDILPMDACHLLLGRPWLYDRKVNHDGFLNTYSLLKDGKKITLAPLPPHQITKSKTVEPLKDGGVLLTLLEPTLKAELREFKAFKEMILHTPTQSEPSDPLHPLAKPLLLEFSHVFPRITSQKNHPTPYRSHTRSHSSGRA